MKQAKVAILFILTSILSNDGGACGTNKQISKITYKFDHVHIVFLKPAGSLSINTAVDDSHEMSNLIVFEK